MASTFATTASSASAIATKAATNLPHRCSLSKLSFHFSPPPKPKLRFFTKGSPHSRMPNPVIWAQLDEVAVDGSSNDAAASQTKSKVVTVGTEDVKQLGEPLSRGLASEDSISEFITQVSSLVKLVDSRDIIELQLKQLDCEVTIRKKEAIPQPPSSAEVSMIYAPPSQLLTPATPSSTQASTPAAAPPAPSTSRAAVKSVRSSHPPLKCPMAGTFYRSPAPGEPAFVKVGDKVKKGQVLCIIEAMKLMNEIEADQSGTIVDILAEDGKPVSVDTPLFVIEP